LVLSGGVSAGVLDLVPSVLAEMHVEQVFHKVSIKPGKPLWFGVHRKPTFLTRGFGLPGNPVSSLVCFERFARPAIARLAGYPMPHTSTLRLPLAQEFTQRGERVTYAPAQIVNGTVELLRSQG